MLQKTGAGVVSTHRHPLQQQVVRATYLFSLPLSYLLVCSLAHRFAWYYPCWAWRERERSRNTVKISVPSFFSLSIILCCILSGWNKSILSWGDVFCWNTYRKAKTNIKLSFSRVCFLNVHRYVYVGYQQQKLTKSKIYEQCAGCQILRELRMRNRKNFFSWKHA